MKTYCILQPNMRTGETLRNVTYLKWRLKRGLKVRCVLLTEAPGMEQSLALMNGMWLRQSYYLEHPLKVYGLAASREEAQEMLIRISDEAAERGMPGELKRYLEEAAG